MRAASPLVAMPGGHPQVHGLSAGHPDESGWGAHECARHGLQFLAASAAALGLFALAAAAQTAAPAPDPVFRAMRDEIERSRKLTIPDLEAPYFIEYVMDEQETFTVSASLGGLLSRRRERFRAPDVLVRVGDYKFDNTNFAAGGGGSRYDLERFPVEDAYAVLRRYLWLETDSAYKAAVEAISRKRAAMGNITQNEQLNDFAHAEPVRYIRDIKPLVVDENALANRVRALSAIFAQFPGVMLSTVDLEATEGGYYLVNSEGTEVRVPESVTILRVRATAQAADGSTVRDRGVPFIGCEGHAERRGAEPERCGSGAERGGAFPRGRG